jgi:hypothetical protein
LVDPSASAWAVLRDDGSVISPEDFPVKVALRTGQKLSYHVAGFVFPDQTRWVLCNAYPEYDAAGCIQLVVVCFTDCTALNNIQQAL